MNRHVCSVLLIISSTAFSATGVTWQATDRCPAPADQFEGPAGAEVQVVERLDGWQVTVLFFEPDGVRRVRTKTCDEAIRAAKSLLQLGAPERSSRESPREAAEHRWHIVLSGGVAIDVGTLPAAEPRFAISSAASHGLLRLVADVRVGLPGKLSAAVSVHRAFEFQGAGCFNFASERVAFAPCFAASIGTWAADDDTRAVMTVGPQLRVAAKLFSNIEAGAMTGMRFNVMRAEPFDTNDVFSTPLITADLQFTLGWRW